MSLEDLGNIGEFVAAVAVVISLVYLAIQIRQNTGQIRQNTHAVKVASTDTHLHYGMQFRSQIIQDGEVAQLWRTALQDRQSLPVDDRVRFDMLMVSAFASIQNRFLHSQQGIVQDEYMEAWESTLQTYACEPGVQEWWPRSKQHFACGFVEHVDALVAKAKRQARSDSGVGKRDLQESPVAEE